MLRHIKKLFLKRNAFPEYYTLFVTNRCNASCAHCFYWKELNQPTDELTLQELQLFSDSIPDFHFLQLTGGEPFLRKDIVSIIKLFHQKNAVKDVSIMSNGYFPELITTTAREVLQSCPKLRLRIYLSLDFIGAAHDQARQLPSGFARLTQTTEQLKAIKREDSRLTLAIVTTFSSLNQEVVEQVYEYVRDVIQPDTFNCPLVRGELMNAETKKVDLKCYTKLMKQVETDLLTGRLKGVRNSFSSFILHGAKFAATNNIIRTARENHYSGPCFAGTINAVIYPNGDVYPCELLAEKKMGNLREVGFDFPLLWRAQKSRHVREFIRDTKCRCTHGCPALTNVLYNPLKIPRVILNAIQFGAPKLG